MTGATLTAARPRLLTREISPRTWADTGVVVVLGFIAMVGFGSTFDALGYLLAGVGGLLLAAVVVLVCTHFRVNVLLAVAATILAWYLFGSAIALPGEATFGFLPNVTTLVGLSLGTTNGWSDLVTLRAPVSLPGYINALPYSAGAAVSLISALLATRLLTRGRRTALKASTLLLAPLALYAASVLLGTEQPYFAGLRGIAFAALALVWLGWRRRDGSAVAIAAGGALLRRKLFGTAILVVVAIAVGAIGGGLLAPAASSRFVLRDRVQPPFQPLTYPTPLAGFRHYTKTLNDKTLFTVSGLKSGQLLRLASLDTYNGEIWGVAGAQDQSDASGSFRLVGRTLPKAPTTRNATTSTITVRVDDYSDVWLPSTGYDTKLAFAGSTGSTELEDVRYNDATGTAVLTTGLKRGATYTVSDEVATAPSDSALTHTAVASFAPSLVSHTPDQVVAKALQLTSKVDTPIAKLRAIQQYLYNTGYFSHGTLSDQVPSRAGHGADRMYDMVTQTSMVGDQEQYASLFALMARSLNYPVRVVMGFDPKVSSDSGRAVNVTGAEVTAWDEVAFQGVGWVPFFPTPKNPDVPQSQVPKPQTEPQPQVRQPPRSNSDPDDLVTPVELNKAKDHKKNPFGLPTWVIVTLGIVLVVLILIFVPLLLIGAAKRKRLRRRRGDPRGDRAAAGAWDELLDQFSELGYLVPTRVTRTVSAARLGDQFGEPPGDLRALAVMTDVAVFSGETIERSESERVWAEAMATAQQARGSVSSVRRILARYRVSAARAWVARVTTSAVAQSDALLKRTKREPDE